MNIVSYGGGTNSTAMLIECVKRSIKIELILFADTGGERPETYSYMDLFSKWLIDNGAPEIVTVRKGGNGETLEQDCLRRGSLPSIAYGWKTCSQRFKLDPQKKYLNNWPPIKELWKSGKKATRFIGFDADEPHRVSVVLPEDQAKKYENRYPLIEWDMGRDECIETIKQAGLPLPGKSACFFCPSSKPHEVRDLQLRYPELAERALAIEANAELTTIKGLGRNWAWRDLLATQDMFADEACTVDIACGCYDG